MSGEIEASEALALAVRLASALDPQVHVAHVTEAGANDDSLAARARYADAVHHEYRQQLEEFIRRTLPHCRPEECRRITDVALCHGAVGPELLRLAERKPASALAVGWHGRFMVGHARVLKYMIERITMPLLLARPPPAHPSD